MPFSTRWPPPGPHRDTERGTTRQRVECPCQMQKLVKRKESNFAHHKALCSPGLCKVCTPSWLTQSSRVSLKACQRLCQELDSQRQGAESLRNPGRKSEEAGPRSLSRVISSEEKSVRVKPCVANTSLHSQRLLADQPDDALKAVVRRTVYY